MGWKSTGAVDRAQSFPGEAGPCGRGAKPAQECRGRELSLSLWCWHWAANSLLENFTTAYCLLVTQKYGNCSNTLLSLTQLLWMFINSITAALQSTASVSKADFSQKKMEEKNMWKRKEAGREGKVQIRLWCFCCLPIFLQFGSN